jgi:hypothetical protein
MVEVFKTNVQEVSQTKQLAAELLEHFPKSDINFDFEDCDKILRIEAENIDSGKIILILREKGFVCEVLPD